MVCVAMCHRHCHQSLRLALPGLARFRPPRSRVGMTLPPMIVSRTTASTWCGVTLPYQMDEPCGVYICVERRWRKVSKRAYLSFMQSLTMQFPANLWPPMCEHLRIKARLCPPAACVLSCSRMAASRSSGVPGRSSMAVSAGEMCRGSSICVCTSQCSLSRAVVRPG